jgi:hypothetical protein
MQLEEINDQLSKVKDKLIQEVKDSLDKTKTDATDAKIETDVLRRILYSKEFEKTSARNLEQEKNQFILTVAALEESNSKMKIEIVKMKDEKDTLQVELAERNNFKEIQNTLEDNAESKSRKALEDSAVAKLKKLRDLMAAKVYLLDPSNEELENLQSIDIEKLFLKYEKGMTVKDSFKEKYEETRETLSDIKTKLQLKSEKIILLEKQLIEIMGSEQEETEHYTNATSFIHSTTNTE